MLWFLFLFFLTGSDVLEFYSSKHLAATAFDDKGKANAAIILALYDSSNLKVSFPLLLKKTSEKKEDCTFFFKCKRLLKKPRMQFEDRWLADNFLITGTHDYGKEGSELSKTLQVRQQCPTIVYIPKESEVKTGKDGELKGVSKWDGKVTLRDLTVILSSTFCFFWYWKWGFQDIIMRVNPFRICRNQFQRNCF